MRRYAVAKRRLAAAAALLLGSGLLGACGGDGKGDWTAVSQPGRFEAEVPPGWAVVVPAPADVANDPGERPIAPEFSSSNADGAFLAVFADGTGGDIEAVAWAERLTLETSAFDFQDSDGTLTADAIASGRAPGAEADMEASLHLVQAKDSASGLTLVVFCSAPELAESDCGEITSRFRLAAVRNP